MAGYSATLADAVASWALQESSGITAADSAGTHSATLKGGLDFQTASAAGPTGWLPAALRLDGAAGYVTIPSPATLGLGVEHSIAFWVRSASASPTGQQVLLEVGGTKHCTLFELDGGLLRFSTTRDYVYEDISTTLTSPDAWRHVAGVHRDGSLELYVDGVLASSGSITAAWDEDGSHQGAIGAADAAQWSAAQSSGPAAFFDGDIAGVVVHQRALSAAEVGELFAGPEPVGVASPTIEGSAEVTRRVALSPGSWDGKSNGVTVLTHRLQQSADGVGGWADVAGTVDQDEFAIPTNSLGQFLRIVASASNNGGASDDAYSAVHEVTPAGWTGGAIATVTGSSGSVASSASPAAKADAALAVSN